MTKKSFSSNHNRTATSAVTNTRSVNPAVHSSQRMLRVSLDCCSSQVSLKREELLGSIEKGLKFSGRRTYERSSEDGF